MKHIIIFVLFFQLGSCLNINSKPDHYLSKSEIEKIKLKTVYYFEGLPKNVSETNKFDSINSSYYLRKAKTAEIIDYYPNKDSFIYFTVIKIAPSLKQKYTATIVKCQFKNDSISYYEEICRTWKMEKKELLTKSKIIFDKVVSGEDISIYYTKNMENEFWIEFPDEHNFYNISKRKWEFK